MIYLGSNQITKIYLGGSDLAAAYLADTKVYPEGAHDYSQDYFTTVALGDGTIDFSGYSSNKLSYSTDEGSTWTEMTSQSESVPVNEGDRVMWKGTPTYFHTTQGMGKFMATANFNVEGNIMSLLFDDNFEGQTDLTGKGNAFRALFVRNTNLISAENLSLPATTLASRCYQELFFGCTNLTTAPQLPATTLTDYCYATMFYNCSSLTTAPELPATTLANYCYSQMFRYCTNLTAAPSVLPATTLASNCYQTMFNGCTSLTTATQLPATTLADYCYAQMFNGCTSLTTATQLPATTVANSCYYGMFQGCTNLTAAPSVLPATTLTNNCYQAMFSGCTSLTTAPQLPATTLAEWCYSEMFRGCTSLTTAPALPATTFPNSSCYLMFYGCTSLTEIQSLNLSNVHKDACNQMFAGCTSLESITLPSVYSFYTTRVTNSGACRNMFSGCSSLRYVNADENYDANIVVTASQDGCREMFRGSGLRSLHVVARSQAPRGLLGMFNECHSLTNVYVDVTLDNNANQGAIWMFTDSSMQTLSGKITMSSVFSGATYMMQRCTSLTDASNFEIDIQGRVKMQNCDSMFDHCSSLRNLPHFSTATTEIGDYSCQYMFANCTSLTSAKDLYVPSGYLGTGACQYMFKNCTSLTDSPVLSAATVGNSSYYQMFYNCSNLSEITCLATNISAAHSTETWTTNVAPSGTFYKAAEMENWQIDSVNGIPQGWTVKNYGEKDYSQEYFTTVALGSGNISFSGSNTANTFSYSTDNGSTWSTPEQVNTVAVNNGDKVLWKGTPSPVVYVGIGIFTTASTASFGVEGNVMSLMFGDNFDGQTDLTEKDYAFYNLFSGSTQVVSAENLVLPATTLALYCYAYMFQDCTSLTTAPQLTATTLAQRCYENMFQGCTSLTTAPELPATTLATSCYNDMFRDCTSLTTAPSLPATTLSSGCYYKMFSGCTSLTTAPQLPATNLGGGDYIGMFAGCTSLTEAPQLPATTLTGSCYSNMFQDCTSLTTAPQLPATTLTEHCYLEMFGGCTSLTTAPELPATTLATSCYASMFRDCTSLTTAPELHATTLAQRCYYNMFSGCTSLTTAPQLPATTLTSQCYENMFNGCTNLNSITCLATDISATSCTTNWVSGVSATGTFTKAAEMEDWLIDSVNGIPVGWTVKNYGEKDYSTQYFTTVALGSGNISLSGSNAANTFSYSTDGGQNWSTPAQVNTVPVSNGDKVLWKGEAILSQGIGRFTSATTANFNAEGNAMSLLYGDNFVGQTDLTGKNSAFANLFSSNTHLVSTENLSLPATTLAPSCYGNMFKGCTSLTTAPSVLPATTLAERCYFAMFSGCTNLTTAPELSATTLADSCYQSMFRDCTSLTTAPQLPATTLARNCYATMLRGTSITEAPELPATTLTSSCYSSMFRDCTSLTSITCLATDISAQNCTSNWVNGVAATGTFTKAAEMEDWQIDSVNGIPQGWTVKNYGEKDYSQEYFTTVALSNGTIRFKGSNSSNKLSYSTDSGSTWTEMTSQTVSVPVNEGDSVMWKGETTPIANGGIGTFTSAATASFDVEGNAMSLLFGDNFQGQTDLSGNGYSLERLFSGNTHLASAENLSLPATTLSSGCYKEMFSGCTNLTTAPQLPAMTLTEICYSNMFDSCTSLAIAPELPATTLGRNCYQAMFQGCTSLTTAPTVLPATTLAIGCYGNMFQGCTNLTTAPSVLSATALTNSCYSRMFQGCTNLSTAPQLPATTLADYCYEGMFMSCGSLTTAPALPATTLANYSYNNMFYRCSNISSIACLATDISATDCTKDWVDGVASTGTFTKAASMNDWTTGVDGIPQNWTVVDA